MKQKLLFVNALFLLSFNHLAHAQETQMDFGVRTTTGVAGSSEIFIFNNSSYLIQQSIGQASAIGTFYHGEYVVRQGFIQPDVLAKIRDTDISLSLEAIIYPNPFIQSITISFTENISGKIDVIVFDIYGRKVFSKIYSAEQEINVQLDGLSLANYIIKITANNKQFIKNILRK